MTISIAEFPFDFYQTRNISCRSPQCIPAHNEATKHHWTDLLQIAGPLVSLPSWSDMQQDVT
jgi:hypothetical protein